MNGNKYEGSFAKGRQNGKGKLTQIDGDTYEGSGRMVEQMVRERGTTIMETNILEIT